MADLTREFHIRAMGETVQNQQIKIDLLETQLAELSLKYVALELALIGVTATNPNTLLDRLYENYLGEQDRLRAVGIDRDNITMDDLFLDNYGLVNGAKKDTNGNS